MVDIHSHIIWDVDDGAQTLDDSLAMLRLAAECGTTDIVATPHANSDFRFDLDVLDARYRELAERHSGPPRIHRGCDFHLSIENIQACLENPAKYTVNGGRYLMVELPEMFSPASMEQALTRLMRIDLVPVITHPERNPVLQRTPSLLRQWIDLGCRGQVTAQSLTGRFGRSAGKAGWSFLRSGCIHFVASDGHDVHHRPPRLDQARDALSRQVGEDAAQHLTTEYPRALIENREVPADALADRLTRRKWYHFWR